MVTIRAATLADLPGAYRVCLLTGDAGADGSTRFRNPDLLGHVFVGPYIAGERSLANVVVDEDGVAGYCLAALDTRAFRDWAEAEWWPVLRAQYPLLEDGSEDAEIIRLIHEPPIAPAAIVDRYPSHLHIDLLDRARGSGLGRHLIDGQVAALRERGSRGVHLDVAATNTNAISFYRHLGFGELATLEDSILMGRLLA